MTLNANTKPPSTVSALETISILMIAGSVIFNGIKIDGDLISSLLSLALILWLVLKVTRRRSSRARVALTVMAALGLGAAMLALVYYGSWTQVFKETSINPTASLLGAIVGLVLTVAQLILLWHPMTTEWVQGRSSKSPEPVSGRNVRNVVVSGHLTA